MSMSEKARNSLSVKLKYFLGTSWVGTGVVLADVLLSSVYCCNYVAGTYYFRSPFMSPQHVVTLLCICFFGIVFGLKTVIASHPGAFLLSLHGVGELLSMLPIAAIFYQPHDDTNLRLLQLPAVLRIFQLAQVSRWLYSDINKQLFRCGPAVATTPPCVTVCGGRGAAGPPPCAGLGAASPWDRCGVRQCGCPRAPAVTHMPRF